MKTADPRPPKGLSRRAVAWWKRLVAEYEDWSADSLLILEAGLQAFDRWQAARATVDAEGATVHDRFNQVRAHPACAIERDSRAGMLAAFRQLGLSDEPTSAMSASQLGRRAAMARWHRGAA